VIAERLVQILADGGRIRPAPGGHAAPGWSAGWHSRLRHRDIRDAIAISAMRKRVAFGHPRCAHPKKTPRARATFPAI